MTEAGGSATLRTVSTALFADSDPSVASRIRIMSRLLSTLAPPGNAARLA
jgi:hypothetical protein